MSCLNSTRRAILNARLSIKQSQLEKLYATLDDMVEDGNIEQYKFDSGEGQQQTKYRSFKDVQDAIDKLEAEIDNIVRALQGGGIVNMNLRRKGYNYNRGN